MRLEGEEAKRVLASVAEPESWGILQLLLTGPKDATALEEALKMPHSTLYRKIAQLKERGLLMVDSYVIKPGGKREALFSPTFNAINFVAEPGGIRIDLVETQKSIERRWLRLFTVKNPPPEPASVF